MSSWPKTRGAVGAALLTVGVTAAVKFGIYQAVLAGLSPDGVVMPFSWLRLRIMLVSCIAPGAFLLFIVPFAKLLARFQTTLKQTDRRTFLAWTVLIAGGLRIIAVLILPLRLYVDYATYDELGRLWAATGTYTDGHGLTGYFPPGFPFWLSRLYLAFGHQPQVGIAANLILSVGIVYLGYRLVQQCLGERPARWTAILLAVSPSQVLFVNLLGSEILFTFLFLSSLVMFMGEPKGFARSAVHSATVGAVLGAATLVRALTLLFPLVLIPSYFFRSHSRMQALVRSLALVIGMAVVVGPWIARNHHQVGRTTIATNGGVNLYIGNNPNAAMGYNNPDSTVIYLRTSADESHDDSAGYALAWDYIRHNPLAFVERGILKVIYFLGSDTEGLNYELIRAANAGTFDRFTWSAAAVQAYYLVFLLLTIGGIASFVVSRELPRHGGNLWLLTILYWLAVHFVFFGNGRFHFPIVPLMAGFAGLAIVVLAQNINRATPPGRITRV